MARRDHSRWSSSHVPQLSHATQKRIEEIQMVRRFHIASIAEISRYVRRGMTREDAIDLVVNNLRSCLDDLSPQQLAEVEHLVSSGSLTRAEARRVLVLRNELCALKQKGHDDRSAIECLIFRMKRATGTKRSRRERDGESCTTDGRGGMGTGDPYAASSSTHPLSTPSSHSEVFDEDEGEYGHSHKRARRGGEEFAWAGEEASRGRASGSGGMIRASEGDGGVDRMVLCDGSGGGVREDGDVDGGRSSTSGGSWSDGESRAAPDWGSSGSEDIHRERCSSRSSSPSSPSSSAEQTLRAAASPPSHGFVETRGAFGHSSPVAPPVNLQDLAEGRALDRITHALVRVGLKRSSDRAWDGSPGKKQCLWE